MLTIACLVLHYQSLSERQPHTILIAAGAFVGYTIILIGLFIGKFKKLSPFGIVVQSYNLQFFEINIRNNATSKVILRI